jgi:hypothetical protein
MAKKELVDYIKKEVAAGYDVSYLKSYLISQGYNAQDVQDAIDSISKPAVKIPGSLLIIGALAVVIIIGGIFAVSKLMGEAPEVEILPQQTVQRTQPTLPATTPTTQASAAQQGVQPEVEVRYIPSTPAGLTIGEVLNRIPHLSESEAAGMCPRFSGKDRDNCYQSIALDKGKSSYCDQIINIRKRDNCYMSFAYLEDFSVCTKIQDVYLKQSCRELGRLEFG